MVKFFTVDRLYGENKSSAVLFLIFKSNGGVINKELAYYCLL